VPIAIAGLVGLIYGALCGISSTDFKRLIAFSSLSQMGFILLGAAMLTPASHYGAAFMIMSHGLIVAMLYFLADVAADHAARRNTDQLGGLTSTMPAFWGFTTVGLLAALGLPGSCGFVGPVLILPGTFAAAGKNSVLIHGGQVSVAAIYAMGIIGCIGTILSAVAMLRPLHRNFGGRENAKSTTESDVGQRELAILIPLTVMIVLLGIVPAIAYFAFTRTTIDALDRVLSLR
jgi:NADH-quinone oxidoreductase subunit M